jgi:DNA-binding TFAR19-related protein (PDSD5 family)
MDNDIRKARIETLERYLAREDRGEPQTEGADSKIYSLFLAWYTEPYMQDSRIKTVALAKRMLAELTDEMLIELSKQPDVRGQT